MCGYGAPAGKWFSWNINSNVKKWWLKKKTLFKIRMLYIQIILILLLCITIINSEITYIVC